MAAITLDGREVSDALMERAKHRLQELDFVPRLVFVRVGDDPASSYYVRSKNRLAGRVGILSEVRVLPESVSLDQVLGVVRALNQDPETDGILVQLPLPDHLDARVVVEAIAPEKDVDGLHPVNVGRLWNGDDGLFPATPSGLLEILDHYRIGLEGSRAVIVGRSNLVGKPAAALLLRRNATVTVAHSRTRDIGLLTREADVLVSAVGRPGFIRADMVKPGAVVLDVGISRVEGRIVGDVDPAVTEQAGFLTPMPGGTGLVTVAMVIQNTLLAATLRRGRGG